MKESLQELGRKSSTRPSKIVKILTMSNVRQKMINITSGKKW